MQDQFLTLKKSKNRAIGESDKQEDAIIDMRGFYHCEEDEDQHFRDVILIKGKPVLEEDNENEGEDKPAVADKPASTESPNKESQNKEPQSKELQSKEPLYK
jgi:hypothetical protein